MSIELYPPPRDDEGFENYWAKYIDGICARDNFKPEYLDQLTVLCLLFCEHDELIEDIKVSGRTYISEGRNGEQVKVHPNVTQLNRVRSNILVYTKALGITLIKDTAPSNKDKNKSEWEDEDIE